MSKTAPLYLRLPAELKELVDEEAAASETSLTAVVAHLVEVGLRNSDREVATLRRRIERLEVDVATSRAEKESIAASLTSLREDLERNRAVMEPVSRRLQLPVGACPVCRQPVTGHDVFVSGACVSGHNLQASMVSPSAKSSLNQSDLLAALAVVGIALGVAAVVGKSL